MEIPLEIISLTALGVVGVYFADYLAEKRKSTPIWRYRSHPSQPFNFDRFVRVATNPIMKLVADGMAIHSWDIANITIPEDFKGVSVQVNPQARKRSNIFDAVLADSRMGWQVVYKIGINQPDKLPIKPKYWRIILTSESSQTGQIIKVGIPLDEKILMLRGNQPRRYFAIDPEGSELPISIDGPYRRRDKALQGVRLF